MLPFAAGILATAILIPSFIALSKAEKQKQKQKQNKPIEIAHDVSGSKAEGFVNESTPGNVDRQPSMRNPFNNVLIDEYVYSPTRGAAPDITTTQAKVDLDAMFRTQWYSDPTDVFGKTQSQRMFVSNPSTTIPNDQGSYQNWLYKIPGKTCKEGNQEACYGGTEGAVMPWLNL